MKKLTLTLLTSVALIALVFLNVQIAIAVTDDVGSTKHRVSTYTGAAVDAFGTGPQICVYCHTPHSANSTVAAPLWNRNVTTTGYTMYSSPTIDTVMMGDPTGVSLACLSCHDGQIAIDVIINKPGTTGDTDVSVGTATMIAGATANFDPLLTQDLSDDHPISMAYPTTAQDSMFNAIPTATLSFYDDAGAGVTVQCATCHNPHTTGEKFLRVANDNSALCKTCHIK